MKNLKGLAENCYYQAAMGELSLKTGNKAEARSYFSKALALTQSVAEIDLIRGKLLVCV